MTNRSSRPTRQIRALSTPVRLKTRAAPSIQALREEAEGILALYAATPQLREELRVALPSHLNRWLRAAFVAFEGDPFGWLERHPAMSLPLIEAYVGIRAAIPARPLLLSRRRLDHGEIEQIVESHLDDDEWEWSEWPEIIVDQGWAPGNYLEGDGEETPYDAAGAARAAEDARLDNLLDEEDGRVEHWWSGPWDEDGLCRIVFTPYCMQDGVEAGMYSDVTLDEMAEEERASLADAPNRLAEADDDEERAYVESHMRISQSYLAAVEAEQAYRARTGYAVEEYHLPLSPAEDALWERYVSVVFDESHLASLVGVGEGEGEDPERTQAEAEERERFRSEWREAQRLRFERIRVRNQAKRDMRAALAALNTVVEG